MSATSYVILASAAAAGTGSSVQARLLTPWSYFVHGTFSGATVTIELSYDNTNWFDAGISVTAAGMGTVERYAPYARAVITGGTSPSLTVAVVRSEL